MEEKNLSEEFAYIRDHIARAVRLMLDGDSQSIAEASFMLGCLHNICQTNTVYFHDIECKAALHQ